MLATYAKLDDRVATLGYTVKVFAKVSRLYHCFQSQSFQTTSKVTGARLKTGSSVIFLFAKETVVRRQWETLCDGNTKGRVSHFVGEWENPSFHQNSGYYGYQRS